MIPSEFKPAVKFIAIFLALYLGGNMVYGLFIKFYDPSPDPATQLIASQTSFCLNKVGFSSFAVKNESGPTVFLNDAIGAVLNIYEGCNGVNVMIVFVAFVLAFGGKPKQLGWFLPSGIVVIHLANLARILILYFVSIHFSQYFYYFHKYIFTAILYVIVFLLWYIWVGKINAVRKSG